MMFRATQSLKGKSRMATTHDSMAAWNKLDDGQKAAFIRKAWLAGGGKKGGDAIFMAALQNEVRIEFVDNSVKLIDANGRAIPPAGFKFGVVDANKAFYYVQPELDLRAIYNTYRDAIPGDMEIVTYEYFEVEVQAILAELEANRQVANLTKGLYLPIILPKHAFGDYGDALGGVYLKMVKCAYEEAFPGRTFENYRKGTLAGQVQIVDGTRHDKLIGMMREQSVVGVYTLPFQGFSIPADREMIKMFPDNWLLSGAIDTAMAFAAFPSTLARDYNTPVADCAAVSWQDPGISLCLVPSVGSLVFGSGGSRRGRRLLRGCPRPPAGYLVRLSSCPLSTLVPDVSRGLDPWATHLFRRAMTLTILVMMLWPAFVFLYNYGKLFQKVGSCIVVPTKDYSRRNYISLETYQNPEVTINMISGARTKGIGTACFFLRPNPGPDKVQETQSLACSDCAFGDVDGKKHNVAGPRELPLPQPERRQPRLRQQGSQRERQLLRGCPRPPEVPVTKKPRTNRGFCYLGQRFHPATKHFANVLDHALKNNVLFIVDDI